MKSFLLRVGAIAVALTAAPLLPEDNLLEATGVVSGLAVHLGATDGEIESVLTNHGRILVHGLALDDLSVAAARKNLQAKGLYGLASVEKSTLDPLPYADNLA